MVSPGSKPSKGKEALLRGVSPSDSSPCLGEGKMATVLSIVSSRRYLGARVEPKTWPIASADSNECGCLSSSPWVPGASRRIVHLPWMLPFVRHSGSETEYLRVHRTCQATLRPSSEGIRAGWPDEDPTWSRGGMKVVLFVLVHVVSRRGFLPAIAKCPFLAMWNEIFEGPGCGWAKSGNCPGRCRRRVRGGRRRGRRDQGLVYLPP